MAFKQLVQTFAYLSRLTGSVSTEWAMSVPTFPGSNDNDDKNDDADSL